MPRPVSADDRVAQMLASLLDLIALNRLGLIVLMLMSGACIWYAVRSAMEARETRNRAMRQSEQSRQLAHEILARTDALLAEVNRRRAAAGRGADPGA